MISNRFKMVVLTVVLLTGGIVSAADELTVLNNPKVNNRDALRKYLLDRSQSKIEEWKKVYESLKTDEQIAEYQKQKKAKFFELLGGLPTLSPLKPRFGDYVKRDKYAVEKVIFESEPNFFVTGLLFIPSAKFYSSPFPAVLIPCGHSENGKMHGEYQSAAAFLATCGIEAFVYDPICQGERHQVLNENGKPKVTNCVREHTLLGIGCILLGQNAGRFMLWDNMRAIDYLQSRPEVDPNRIGCTGNSGGGLQTSQLAAVDDRIVAAVVSCYITGFERLLPTQGPQDAEQDVFGQIAYGIDQIDYMIMGAPKPWLNCVATKDFFDIQGAWQSFRYAKRLYTRMGFADHISILENDEGHNYNKTQREGMVRWMNRWLTGTNLAFTEPNIKLLTEKEGQCTAEGEVLLMKGAKSAFDINREYEAELLKVRQQLWAKQNVSEMLQKVRDTAVITKLADIPKPDVQKLNTIERDGYKITKMTFKIRGDVLLPALLFEPKGKSQAAILYINENGKQAEAGKGQAIEKMVQEGKTVLAVDIIGTGEIEQRGSGWTAKYVGSNNGQESLFAYLLAKSFIGMQAEDILACSRWLKEDSGNGSAQVQLAAVGQPGIAALHAAALESSLFDKVTINKCLVSWHNIIELGISKNQLVNIVNGALKTYDLPDLVAYLGNKVTVEEPVDASGVPLSK